MVSEFDILEWAEERQILQTAQPKDQFLKVTEELGEIAECLAKGRPIEELELEIGDLQVTIIILANLCGTTAGKSLEAAYRKIKDRTGSIKSGVFVKDGD